MIDESSAASPPEYELGQTTHRGEIAFISLLRACATLFVVYDHLIGSWLSERKMSWPPAGLIESFITRPFAVIQNFGFLGVVLFFLISGFIITHVAMRETHGEFAVKRLLRIYPPLIASFVLVGVADAFLHIPPHAPWDYVLSSTLVNYIVVPQVVVNGVAWSLGVEVTFYTLVFVSLTWLKERPTVAVAGLTTFAILVLLTARMFGPSYFLFAANMAYVPYLIAGQVLYFAWSRRITMSQFAALTAYVFFAIVLGIQIVQSRFLSPDNSYGVSFLYAYLAFAACVIGARSIKTPPVMEFLARTSYSLYLIHGPIGFVILAALVPVTGYTVAIIVALAAVFAGAALSFRFVELPSQQLARWLLRRTRKRNASAEIAQLPASS